ncbi:tripartite tricarboxylate transporter TctB family protein [Caryophanon tenue]|uniref:DUF1468 domain-containing protein n=1 Tax=Caryophanon tenue TaxID=33978 RepID=A0A1C0YCA1_9BACL|nr:tripartite tricarboxylate transporter TctB family protein [Caryophanon tenue]OCS84774.1 hypothetical protein A6M13_04120 [Caryophanon tenue]
MKVNVKDLNVGVWAGLIILVFAIITFIISFQYSYSGIVGPGPGFFPFWLSLILIILAVLYIYESFKGKNVSDEEWPTGRSLKDLIFIMITLMLFLLLFVLCGFLIAGTVFLFVLFVREFKLFVTVSMSVGITLFIYIMFNNVLKVHLPSNGILF